MMSLWDALRMNMMISYQELVRTFPKPVIHNKDWRFKRFAVELPPSLRVTKVVNHKPRIGKPSVAFTWDRVKN
ncbi:ydjO [Escherichia coli]|nr:ydjO [Escherichia coli]